MTWKPLPDSEPPTPETINKSLSRITSRLGLAAPKTTEAVFSQWSNLVGDQLANKCQPLTLVDDVLTVEAVDSRWATQMKWLAPQLVVKLNEATGQESVKRIEVRVSGGKPLK